jgi:hypothetical protein
MNTWGFENEKPLKREDFLFSKGVRVALTSIEYYSPRG